MANSYVTDAPTVARMLYRATQVFAHARCLGTPVIRAVSPEHVETKLPESSSGTWQAGHAASVHPQQTFCACVQVCNAQWMPQPHGLVRVIPRSSTSG